MSTSYKSLFPASAPAPVESFRYPESHGVEGAAESGSAQITGDDDELPQLLLRAHAEGVREGEELERARAKQQLEQERAKITETILRFQTGVAEYFSRIELEVVQLSLAIAAKILRREAHADPSLLAKLTKGVLESLHQQTKVNVRVSPAQVESWRGELRAHEDGKVAIEVIADDSVPADHCVLQTELGMTEIGIDVQLHEIENGMLDLLAQAPDQR